MRVRIDDGVYIDFYNLHADAGYVLSNHQQISQRKVFSMSLPFFLQVRFW